MLLDDAVLILERNLYIYIYKLQNTFRCFLILYSLQCEDTSNVVINLSQNSKKERV
jgi:uncharacterized protein YydD (DUF2326 family)